MEQKLAITKSDLAKLSEEQNKISKEMPERTRKLFDKLYKGRNGLALAKANGGDCGGCHMQIPPQIINDIKRLNALITCDSCGRILYWDTSI